MECACDAEEKRMLKESLVEKQAKERLSVI